MTMMMIVISNIKMITISEANIPKL